MVAISQSFRCFDEVARRAGVVQKSMQWLDRVAGALHDLRASQAREAVWVTHAGVTKAVMVLAERGYQPPLQASEWPTHGPGPGGLCAVALCWPLRAGSRAAPR